MYRGDSLRLCDGVVQPEGARGFEDGKFHLSLTIKYKFRDVAQLVARLLWEQDVAGSNPVIPTKKSNSSPCGSDWIFSLDERVIGSPT